MYCRPKCFEHKIKNQKERKRKEEEERKGKLSYAVQMKGDFQRV